MSRPSTGPFVGALLRLTWQGVRDHIYEAVKDAGYDDLNPAHVSMFRHPTLDGMRPSEVAEALMISKQSVNDLLGDLEGHGYITREIDPSDRRGRLVRLTNKGKKLEDTTRLAAKDAERRLQKDLGPERFRAFKESLSTAAQILTERSAIRDA